MIHVIAIIKTAPGRRDNFLAEFKRLVPLVRAEPGCIEYAPAIDAATGFDVQKNLGPDAVMVIEKWESTAALKSHLSAPHMVEYRGRVKGLVAGTEIHVLEPAGV